MVAIDIKTIIGRVYLGNYSRIVVWKHKKFRN